MLLARAKLRFLREQPNDFFSVGSLDYIIFMPEVHREGEKIKVKVK